MSKAVDTLFRPFQFGSVTLKNRIVMAPMTRSFSPGHVPGKNVAAYYRRRAEGGVGLIITEGTTINHIAARGYPDTPDFHGTEALKGWKQVVDEVHEVGGRIIPQLWHVGNVHRLGKEPYPDIPGYGPSVIRHGIKKHVVEMTQQDIDDVVSAYADAAKSARELGFDGLELHGAHGYLIDQFFWDGANHRKDKYGGSLENRLRFGIEIIRAVRNSVGPDFPVVLRFSQWKADHYHAKPMNTPQEMERFLTPLSEAGVDIFHASTRRYWIQEFEGSDLNLAGWARKITGKPVITVGSVGLDNDVLAAFAGEGANPTGIDKLLDRLERDEFDLVALGRALLADAEWSRKIREGRNDEIKPFNQETLKTLV